MTRRQLPQRSGFVQCFFGPMRSGKTRRAIVEAQQEHVARHGHDQESPYYLKPSSDTRSADLRSRSGLAANCELLSGTFDQTIMSLEQVFAHAPHAVVIDEVQFLPLVPDRDSLCTQTYIDLFVKAAKQGFAIIISGLDADFTGKPFPISAALALNPRVRKRYCFSVCVCCGSEKATLTQRLYKDEPASRSMPAILPEGEDGLVAYEPRCLRCHIIPD